VKKRILLVVFSSALILSSGLILRYRVEPFQYFFYLISWWSYIVFADAVLSFRENKFLILNRGLPLLIVISCGFWCVFEIINLRIQNWFYINLPGGVCQRYAGYLLAFGTVIPAIYVTKEIVRPFVGEMKIKPFRLDRYPVYATLVGVATLLLLCLWPLYCFALTWIFLALILDGFNYRRGYASFMRDFEEGVAGNFIATLLSGLACGIIWETWNYWSVAKWVYTVPFFENIKIYEMPLAGYIGFPVFSLEAIVFLNLLKGIWTRRGAIYVIALASLAFSLFTFAMIDRYTVFSYTPLTEELSFIDRESLDRFTSEGVRTAYGIDVNLLSEEEKEYMKLLHLKGLGLDNLLRLKGQGINDVRGLSRLDENSLSEMLGEKNLRRVRVYLEAARREAEKQ
jgi:hypothetical protein